MTDEELKEEKGTGAVPSPRDPRDFVFRAPVKSAPFDWELGFDIELLLGYRKVCKSEAEFWGPKGRAGWGVERYREIVAYCKTNNVPPVVLNPNDQGSSSSCTGQGSSKYGTVLDFIEVGKYDENSAKDIYSYITLGLNQGAYLRDAMDRFTGQGNAKERLVPSTISGKPPTEQFMVTKLPDTPEIKESRLRGKALKYKSVNVSSIDEFAWAILLNFGVYFGLAGTWEGNWSSSYPKPPKPGEEQWFHAIWAGKAKLTNGKKYVGLLNSWGNVGSRGWQWLGQEYFTNPYGGVFEAWTLEDMPNGPDNMQSNSKIIKLIYPDGSTAIAVADPATKPAGLISMTRNRGIEIPLKPDPNTGEPNQDIDWANLKIDGECRLTTGSSNE